MRETILIAEDEPVQRRMLETLLTKKLGYDVLTAENGQQAIERVEASSVGEIAAAIFDISMPVMDGFEALKWVRKFRPDIPVIMLTAHDYTPIAVRAIKEGAYDFAIKPADHEHLAVVLKNAIRAASLAQEVARLKRDKEGALLFTDLVGHKAGLKAAVVYGYKAAASDVPVLITGETGSGKELFARAIHGESRRVGSPFVAINCGAIPANLVESILFGHEKGAFTGAVARTMGKFREADGGTIFLDEIGDLPLEAQVKLLRVLQQKEVEPVGASKPIKVNVRVISATHRDVKAEVKAGRFREDLFFRLNVLPIHVLPLRERKEDILPLVDYFTHRFASTDMLEPRQLAEDAQHYIMHHEWKGNVRELENLIHRALVLCEGEVIFAKELMLIHDSGAISSSIPSVNTLNIALQHANGNFKTMEKIEAEAMQAALNHYGDNITKAADALGIAKSTFYRKLKES